MAEVSRRHNLTCSPSTVVCRPWTGRDTAQRNAAAQPGPPHQVASSKSGYWEWAAAQIECPGRPQVKNSSCRETAAWPRRILDGCPCASHFSYLSFHCSACPGCTDLKFLLGGIVFVPLVSTQRLSSPRFWRASFRLLQMKLLGHRAFKTCGLVFCTVRSMDK